MMSMDLRTVDDFRTDAYLVMKCTASETTLKKEKFDCAKSTIDTVENNLVYRTFFNWDEWYHITILYMITLWSLVGTANGWNILMDGDYTGNKCSLVAMDLLDAHNYVSLYHKLGLKYGFTSLT